MPLVLVFAQHLPGFLYIRLIGPELHFRLPVAAVLGQCPSLAHLELGINGIESEGAGLLRASALPSLDLF